MRNAPQIFLGVKEGPIFFVNGGTSECKHSRQSICEIKGLRSASLKLVDR